MRIALFSDVHGNAAALRAVLRAIDRLAPDRIFALGDLVGRGPEPDRCVRMIQRRGIPFIRGNWDAWVAGEDGWDERAKRKEHVEAARRLMKRQTIEHLLEGPPTRKLAIAGVVLYLAHGSPRDPVDLLGPETSEEELRRAIKPASDADVIALGHSHRAFVKRVDRSLVINTGTVGYPFDGDPRATFVLLTIDGRVEAEIIRVPYRLSDNLRALRRAVKRRVMPRSLALRYRRALLGEGNELAEPPPDHLSGVEAILRLLAQPIQRAYGSEEASLEALLALREAIGIALPALARRRARRPLRILETEIALRDRIAFAEGLAHRDSPVAAIARVRARRLKKRAADLFPRERRIRLGLVWLELAMRTRDRDSTLKELTERARPFRRATIDSEAILDRWRKRAVKHGGPGAT